MKETRSMFNECVIQNTRQLLDEGKVSLNRKSINIIIAYSLKKYDKLNGIKIKKINEYIKLAEQLPNNQEIHNLVVFLIRTYKTGRKDINLEDAEKIQIYKNSVVLAKKLCSDMRATDKYNKNTVLKQEHTDRFDNCYYKATVLEDMKYIFKLLKKINANFINILDDGYSFYPIITDFLVDTLSLEYSYELNKLMVKNLARDFDSLSIKKDILRTSNAILFSQVEFTKKVQRKRINLYILHEYARKFNCDISLMRELQMELLYWDAKDHPRALKSSRFNIQGIKARNFILTQCKFIGLVD